jgi:hypothetical protein
MASGLQAQCGLGDPHAEFLRGINAEFILHDVVIALFQSVAPWTAPGLPPTTAIS